MKRSVLILITVVTANLQAQNVDLNWVKQIGGNSHEGGYAIVLDKSGNIYTTGAFSGTADFDPGANVFNLSTKGSGDIFISKSDSNGNFIWAKQMAGDKQALGEAIALDNSGNIFITGTFTGTVDFDPGIGVFNLSSVYINSYFVFDAFVCKLDAAGNFVWAKQMGGPDTEHSLSIAVDASGNVYTTGYFGGNQNATEYFGGTVDFDPGVGVYNLTSFGHYDIFVSKLDANGNFVWAKQMGGNNEDNSFSIAVDALGNTYTTGTFGGPSDFDPGVGVHNLTPFEHYDIFVSKLDNAGNFIWVKQMGGIGGEAGEAIALDASGNIYSAGYFSGTVDFDPGAGVFNLSTFGHYDIYVNKLDAAGNFIWAKQMGGADTYRDDPYPGDWPYSITADPAGNVYTTGHFSGVADFDPGICVYNLNPVGENDIFVSKLDAAGNFVWAKQMGGLGFDYSLSVALDASGNVYTTGYFQNTADFDPGNDTYNLSVVGNNDMFIHKMSPCTNYTTSTITLSECGPFTINCNTYSSSGSYTIIGENAAGCDSIITLNLTIDNTSVVSLISASTCNNYKWKGQTITTSGMYKDTLTAANGCDSIVTLQLTIKAGAYTSISQSICQGENYEGYKTSGTYIDTFVAVNGCDSLRTLVLNVSSNSVPDLGLDKVLCPGDSLILLPGQFNSYLWQDGSANNNFIVKQPGLYSVTVTNNCGTARDEVLIKESICDISFPSAFTPNNDGKNDLFKALGTLNLSEYNLAVYNRWGQIIFSTSDYTKGWNGTFNGQLQQTDVYVWYCRFKKPNVFGTKLMKGTVLLIR